MGTAVGLAAVEVVLCGRSVVGEVYDGCLREELRATEGGAVDAVDMGTGEGITLGEN